LRGTISGPGGTPTIAEVLDSGNHAAGRRLYDVLINGLELDSPLNGNAQEITHIYHPTAGDSAATKDYVDTAHVAAFVDPLAATPAAICTALINAGLMAAS
jgi:hypothetical protein